MYTMKNIKITKIETEEGYWSDKKNKHIKYKTPKITNTVVYETKYIYNGNELTEVLAFCSKHHSDYSNQIKVEFDLEDN